MVGLYKHDKKYTAYNLRQAATDGYNKLMWGVQDNNETVTNNIWALATALQLSYCCPCRKIYINGHQQENLIDTAEFASGRKLLGKLRLKKVMRTPEGSSKATKLCSKMADEIQYRPYYSTWCVFDGIMELFLLPH